MKAERADGLVGWSLSVVENSNLMSTPMSALATLFRFSSGKCLALMYCLSYFIYYKIATLENEVESQKQT